MEQQQKIFFTVLGVLVLALVGVAIINSKGVSNPGSVSVEAGGSVIKGVDTKFLNTFKAGDKILLDDKIISIASVNDDFSLTTSEPVSQAYTNVSYDVATDYDAFATCLADKGAVFYGAFWCPHCQNQKKMFGKSAKVLPYVECSTADATAQTQACIDKKISGYPTWEFADGSRLNGEISMAKLAEKTSCPLPAGVSAEVPATVDAGSTTQVK